MPGPSDPELSLYLNTRIFLAGLMDWSGDEQLTAQAIAGSKLLEQGRIFADAYDGPVHPQEIARVYRSDSAISSAGALTTTSPM